MFHAPQERIGIGRRVFAHEITKEEAARENGVSMQSIINYVREYMKAVGIPAVPEAEEALGGQVPDYSGMTREELIAEIMKKDIEVARAKKGYAVKGGGKAKEFSSISDASTAAFREISFKKRQISPHSRFLNIDEMTVFFYLH